MNSTDNQLYTNRNTDKTLVVSLEKIEDYTYMVPSAYIYFGERTEVSNWEKLYISCCKCLYMDYPHIFEQLKGRAITDGQCIDIGDVNIVSDMKAASFIGEGIYVETDFNTADLMKRLRVLLGFCNVNSENLQIECRKETILATAFMKDWGLRNALGCIRCLPEFLSAKRENDTERAGKKRMDIIHVI